MDRSTPDLIARDIIASFKHGFAENPELWTDDKKAECLARLIDKAVRRERAACADIAMGRTYEGRDDGATARSIAATIKQRGYREENGYCMVAHLPQDKAEGLATLRAVFDDTTDYSAHWLFLSTSGVHGSYTNLDEISRDAQRLDNGNCWDVDHDVDCECGAEWDDNNHPYVHPDGSFRITALMVKPRIVQSAYGTVWATVDDIPWLREVVRKTIEGVKQSQNGNTFGGFGDGIMELNAAVSEIGRAGGRRSAVLDLALADIDVEITGNPGDVRGLQKGDPRVHDPDPNACQHPKVMPDFDEKAAEGLSSLEVKKRWPRFEGSCPDCDFSGAMYASFMHYICGDW